VLSTALFLLAAILGLALATVAGFLVHVLLCYTPIIGRIFEEKPVFLPLRVEPEQGGEDVRFSTSDNVTLAGTYYSARTAQRVGVMVFCHEFLSDRWSFAHYCEGLRDRGFDLFTFDFRNHGESAAKRGYQPLQWVTDFEVRDLQAALAYLRLRPDFDPSGVGIFGVSRGGNAALCLAAREPAVWGVITDGAFPTRGTMWAYIHRWAEIYVGSNPIFQRLPRWFFEIIVNMVGWSGRIRSQWRLRCRFPDVEQAVARLAPRPWLMIHGEDDAYISAVIARRFFDKAREPKQLWMVPSAKHNRCREIDPEAYRQHVIEFVQRYAPRRPLAAQPPPSDESDISDEQRAGFAPELKSAEREPVSRLVSGQPARLSR
jgi:pimeloyl-ACP methyl ester carboxylesterase